MGLPAVPESIAAVAAPAELPPIDTPEPLLRNVSLFGMAKLLPAAVNFLAIAIFTRLLVPAEYGRYALVVAGASLVSSVGFSWIRLGLVRLLPAFRHRRVEYLATLLRTFLVLTGISALAGAIWWSASKDPAVRALLPIGLVLLWLTSAFELNLDISVSDGHPVPYGLVSLARAVIGVGTASALAALGYGAVGVLLGLCIGIAVPLAFVVPKNWRGADPRRADAEMLRRLLGYSVPLAATVSLEFIVNASDRFFLAGFKGAQAVGSYAVGYDVSQQTLTVLLVTVNLAAYPAAIRALEIHGRRAAEGRIAQQGVLLACVGLPAAVVLALLAPAIAHLLLGTQFQAEAVRVMPVIALATLVGGAKSYYFDLSFQFARATMNQIAIMTAAALTNVVCNLIWIPKDGPMGAAWATVAAYAVGLVLSCWRGRYVFALPLPWRQWRNAAIAAGFMALALAPFRDRIGVGALALQVAIAGGAFLLAAVALDLLGARALVSRLTVRALARPT